MAHAHDDHAHHHIHEEKRLSPTSATVGFVVVALLGVSVGYVTGALNRVRPVETFSSPALLQSGQQLAFSLPLADSPSWGSEAAPVTVVLFTDLTCRNCESFTYSTHALEGLKASFGPSQLRIVVKHLPSSQEASQLIHRAAFAASKQGVFWEFASDFIDSQATKPPKTIDRALVTKLAEAIHIDVNRFLRDLDSSDASRALAADRALASMLGLNQSPAIVVNGAVTSTSRADAAIRSELGLYERFARGQVSDLSSYFYAGRLALNLPPTFDPFSAIASAPAPAVAQPSVGAAVADGKPSAVFDLARLPMKGNPTAKITILEFSDFECPFCSRVNPTIQQVLSTYPNDVKVHFVHLPLSFHKNAPLAAQASLAAHEQGKFWEYHDILFANQKALTRPDLERYADQLGLDMAKFRDALDTQRFKPQVEAQSAFAESVGVSGTPGFLVNGNPAISGAVPFPTFKATIDAELARADKVAKEKGLSGEALYKELFATAPKPTPREAAPPPPENTTPVVVDITGSPMKGNPNAPITIVEFSDFECPFCSRVNPTIAQLLTDYPNQIKVVFKQLPLDFHKNAPLAAQASLAAHEQGRFWEYHDILFSNQRALTRPDLERYADQLGLDMAKFRDALDTQRFKAQVDKDLAESQKNGIRGTPHFAINGKRLSGAQPVASFKALIDAELRK